MLELLPVQFQTALCLLFLSTLSCVTIKINNTIFFISKSIEIKPTHLFISVDWISQPSSSSLINRKRLSHSQPAAVNTTTYSNELIN